MIGGVAAGLAALFVVGELSAPTRHAPLFVVVLMAVVYMVLWSIAGYAIAKAVQ